MNFSHLDAQDRPVMVDVSSKDVLRRSATAEARVTDANGKLYAHGSTTCMIFPVAEAQRAR